MKKIFILAFSILVIEGVSAQGIKLGIKIGANLSDASGKSFKDGFNFGYHAGLFSELMFSKKFGIQPEFFFSETNLRTGSTFSSLYNNVALTDLPKVKLHYMSIPVLIDYRPISIITFQFGPQFGILMNQSKTLKANAGDAFKKGDLSILGGVQLNLLNIRAYGRYAVGITNINDIDNKDKWNSQTIQLGLGFTL